MASALVAEGIIKDFPSGDGVKRNFCLGGIASNSSFLKWATCSFQCKTNAYDVPFQFPG